MDPGLHAPQASPVLRETGMTLAYGRVSFLRPWVGFVVDAGKVLKIKVGIDLSRGDVAVPQQFLYGAKIARRFEHMAGKTVAQQMRIDALG